jgi:hypothetical protein
MARRSLTLQQYEASTRERLAFPGRARRQDAKVERVLAVDEEYMSSRKGGLARLAAQIENPRG